MESSSTIHERRDLNEAEILAAIRVAAGAPAKAEVDLVKHNQWDAPEAIVAWEHPA